MKNPSNINNFYAIYLKVALCTNHLPLKLRENFFLFNEKQVKNATLLLAFPFAVHLSKNVLSSCTAKKQIVLFFLNDFFNERKDSLAGQTL